MLFKHRSAAGKEDYFKLLSVQDFEEYLWLGSLLETFYLMRHERQSRVSRAEKNIAPSGISLAEVSKCVSFLMLNPLMWHDWLPFCSVLPLSHISASRQPLQRDSLMDP